MRAVNGELTRPSEKKYPRQENRGGFVLTLSLIIQSSRRELSLFNGGEGERLAATR